MITENTGEEDRKKYNVSDNADRERRESSSVLK